MALVRLLLAIALAAVAIAAVLYVLRRDRRYLVFIAWVVKYTLFLLVVALLAYASWRLFVV